jgi:bile acid:Na+ symporter, BASS family
MTVEQLILILLQATLFTSALNLGFGATRFELSFLFRRPGLFARTFLAMYVVVPVVTAVILILVPLPAGVKTAVILLSISPIAITLPFKMEARGANPAYAYSLLIGMSLISVVTVPVSLTILTALPLAHDASIPPIEVVKIIAKTILIPLILGAIIRRFAPQWAERFSKSINAVVGKVTMAALLALLVLNLNGIMEAGVLSYIVIFVLAAVSLAAGHLLGGPAFGDRAALAMASSQRQMGIATLIAAINFPAAVTIDVIVIYLIVSIVATIPYMKWCKKQLAQQPKP